MIIPKLPNLQSLAAISAGLLALAAQAQDYAIDWFSIDSGGGTSTSELFLLSGTIGQPDAGLLSGGNFTLTGGFWGVVETPGAPMLSISRTGPNTITISWPAGSEYWVLQGSTYLSSRPESWTDISPPYETNGSLVIFQDSPLGHKFYRLRHTTP